MTQLFGTNGIRGIVNHDMHPLFALRIGKAWGSHIAQITQNPTVAIATDTRLSNTMLKSALTAGLLSTGCNVEDIGILPTPTAQYAVKTKNYASGIVITASHNPPHFNGIKGIDADGTEFAKPTEEAIEKRYFTKHYHQASWDTVGTITTWKDAIDHHIKNILKKVDTTLIKTQKFTIALDCGNGAGSFVAPPLLKKLGCTILSLNCTPDGTFPGRPSEPTPEHLPKLIKLVKKKQPTFGVALDGDADRAIFIDENGIYLYGDISLTLLAQHIAHQHNGGVFVTPVTTSTIFEETLSKAHGTVHYTPVGSPIVARAMIANQALFGGEENGGLIFPELQYCRDALMTIAKMLELLSTTNQTLSQLTSSLKSYSMIKSKIPCPHNQKQQVLSQISTKLTQDSKIKKMDKTDGLKLYYDHAWVLLRPSGTEPIFRIYAEAQTPEKAQKLVYHYTTIITKLIKEKKINFPT